MSSKGITPNFKKCLCTFLCPVRASLKKEVTKAERNTGVFLTSVVATVAASIIVSLAALIAVSVNKTLANRFFEAIKFPLKLKELQAKLALIVGSGALGALAVGGIYWLTVIAVASIKACKENKCCKKKEGEKEATKIEKVVKKENEITKCLKNCFSKCNRKKKNDLKKSDSKEDFTALNTDLLDAAENVEEEGEEE